jgi:16S rRNA (cytosine1402-N4)-methyltransferase
MVDEVAGALRLEKGYTVLDATVGSGGHAGFILDKIGPDGILIGIDRDKDALETAKKRLSKFGKAYRPARTNFKDLDKVLRKDGIEKIDAALFDIGISTCQFEDGTRGFSFEREGPLDMRMDQSSPLSAYDIVNKYKAEDLEEVIRDFGEERYFRRITGFILERRKTRPINSTRELAGIIEEAVGRWYRHQKIHPATRTFQALRIEANGELDNISVALGKALDFLNSGKRVCVISFHSLEDRIVKKRFKEFQREGRGRIVTKKPARPTDDEIRENPRSRSAKLRVFEKD